MSTLPPCGKLGRWIAGATFASVAALSAVISIPQTSLAASSIEAASAAKSAVLYDDWLSQEIVGFYNASPTNDAQRDDAARAFLKGTVLRDYEYVGTPTPAQLNPLADKALSGGNAHPAVLFAASRLPGNPAIRRKQLTDAIAGLTGQKGAEGVLLLAQIDEWAASGGKGKPEPVLDALKPALAAMKNGSDWVWQMLFWSKKGEKFLKAHGAKVLEVFHSVPNIEPWFKHYFIGRYEREKAWEARGSGWANTVTEAGWKGFGEHLKKARAELTESWKLNPQHPATATAMISVAMGGSEEPLDEMRQWFDRAIGARFDYMPAYDAYRGGLLPRWHGSDEMLLDFGRECAKTGRFDTRVPFEFVRSVRYIIYGSWDFKTLFDEYPVWPEMERIVEGYLASDKRPGTPNDFYTRGAILAWYCEQPDDCHRYLVGAKYQLHPEIARDWNILEVDMWLPRVASATGPTRELFLKAEEQEHRDDFAAAEKTYGEVLAVPSLPGVAKGFLNMRKTSAGTLAKLASSPWQPLLPEKEMAGWTTVVGTPVRNPDGSIEAAKSLMVRRDAPVGPVFELRGEIELSETAAGGIAWGFPNAKDTNWVTLCLERNQRKGGTFVNLMRQYHMYITSLPTPVRVRNKFHLRMVNGRVIVKLGDEVVMDIEQRVGKTLAADSQIGLVTNNTEQAALTRWHGFELRVPATQ